MTALAEKLKSILGKIDEALGEEDWNEIRSVENDVDALITALTESEAVALLTDEPSKTAEELAHELWDKYVSSPGAYVEVDFLGMSKALQSALDANAKAKVEEAVERAMECLWKNKAALWIGDDLRAAILGREVGK